MKPVHLLFFAPLIPLGCANDSPPKHTEALVTTEVVGAHLSAPPEIMSEATEGFYDCVFYLPAIQSTKDGGFSLKASALYHGKPVGLECVLGPKWKTGAPINNRPTMVIRSGTASLKSVGQKSDAFLQAIAKEYQVGPAGKKFAPIIKFSATSLEGDPAKVKTEPVKIKMFFESNEKYYAEFFINIDAKKKRLFLAEKDVEYRKNLLAIFGGAK